MGWAEYVLSNYKTNKKKTNSATDTKPWRLEDYGLWHCFANNGFKACSSKA